MLATAAARADVHLEAVVDTFFLKRLIYVRLIDPTNKTHVQARPRDLHLAVAQLAKLTTRYNDFDHA